MIYFFVCVLVCVHINPQRPEEVVRCPGAGVTGSCEVPEALMWVLETGFDPQEEQ